VSGSIIGAGEAAEGLPRLVLIHGGGCNSTYFEIGPRSTVSAGRAAGCAVLLVDRPGYGGNAMLAGASPVLDSTPLVRQFIDEVRREHAAGTNGIAIIGHSIGASLSVMLAAVPDWPLRGLAISGIGDRPTQEVCRWCSTAGLHAAEPDAALFFGPPSTYGWQAAAALRKSSEPWQMSEVVETVIRWPARFEELAAAVSAPVQIRLAEHEHIWETGEVPLGRMAAAFGRAGEVDAAILAGGGHLYEIHKRGPELVEAQLAFLLSF
jgi:pimeloyl-ACP methyl ester carboxylesterase